MSAIDTRLMRVRTVDATRVFLDPVARCEGCAACPRRCTGILSAFAVDDGLALPRGALAGQPAVGDHFLLRADRAALSRASTALRGLPLAGLLAGAAAGALVAGLVPDWREAFVGIGALTGLGLGLRAASLRMRRQPPAFSFSPCIPSDIDQTPCATHPAS
jgi:hypothetical protein